MFLSTSRRIVSSIINKSQYGMATAFQTPFATVNKVYRNFIYCDI